MNKSIETPGKSKNFHRLRFIILLLFVLANIGNVTGQTRKDIIIYGKLNSKLVEQLPADFRLETYTNILGIDSNVNKTYKVIVRNNSFKVTVKPKADFTYFNFISFPVESWRDIKMAQPGDTLFFDIRSDHDFTFKTNNAELYSCEMELKKANVPVGGTFSNSDTGIVNHIKFKRDSIAMNLDRILLKYHNHLSPETLEILKINFYSELNSAYLGSLWAISHEKAIYTKKEQFAASSAIKEKYQKSRPPKDSSLIINSVFYAPYIVQLERVWNGLFADTSNFKQDRFYRVFKSINNNYTGLLKQKLLTVFFLTYFHQSYNSERYLNSVIDQITESPFKNILDGLEKSKTEGNDAYPFKLESDNGKFYSLADFKGKVMVCKFWFNGCGGCAQQERELQPLRDKYKDNPNIVFISINTDYQKKAWEVGLAKGIYSSPQELNLHTNGLGYRHPMLDFYNYQSFPQLLLIDKNGKIISSSPPRAEDKKSLSELEALIGNHL